MSRSPAGTLLAALAAAALFAVSPSAEELPGGWDSSSSGSSSSSVRVLSDKEIRVDYKLSPSGWTDVSNSTMTLWPQERPLQFAVRAESRDALEIKVVDGDGSTFLRRMPLSSGYDGFVPLSVYRRDLEYGWGGDGTLDGPVEIHFTITGGPSRGTVWLKDMSLGSAGATGTFSSASFIDPHAEDPGVGPEQRRAAAMTPEDPLVLAWFKAVQDSSPRGLLPSMEDNLVQTFNNSLAAMVFVLKGEKERAERILDFYSAATDRNNGDPTLQNFYYRGEARGFFQNVYNADSVRPAWHSSLHGDRWMGDMAWLLLAYKHYESRYGAARYRDVAGKLKDLLLSYYVDSYRGGYLRHGWRDDDARLHEPDGHTEGNIDAYALLRLIGEPAMAEKVRAWLDAGELGTKPDLPLDLYTWRVLAYGHDSAAVLNVPEYDLRYRKTLRVGDRDVVGVWQGPNAKVSNIWVDGLGQLACAYFAVGEFQRGNFYANQLDGLVIDRTVAGKRTRTLPFAPNRTGGYDWVRPDRGFVSAAAWYVFAKNRFNPMTLQTAAAPGRQ